MSDNTESSPAHPAIQRPISRAAIWCGAGLIAANLTILLLLRFVTGLTAQPTQWWVLAALVMFASGLITAIYHHIYWHHPAQRLADLLRQVREGEATIEELDDLTGGLSPIVTEVQETLRELRRQRAEIARMEAEMRQRLANRTDALERSLGVMRQQAARDGLTGLLNRRSLDEILPKIMAAARTESAPLTVLMTDVDNFKPLNDTLGHAAGDDLLRSLGQLLRSTLRDSDYAFRYGGDEFVLLLPKTTREEAEAITQRLTSLVDTLGRPLPVAKPPRLSIGMLCLTELPAEPEQLLREADRLLYEIKAARKGKARAAQPALAR